MKNDIKFIILMSFVMGIIHSISYGGIISIESMGIITLYGFSVILLTKTLEDYNYL